MVGFGDDEAYTLVIARQWALSYFDHPPLHQWILHAFTARFGESHLARAPFWALIVSTNLPLYGLTRRLFGRAAALWALVAFNATPYFLLLPDGFILPDAALLPLIASAVWAIVEADAAPAGAGARPLALWLFAGIALGAAGLDKYMAAFVPLGLAGHFLADRAARRWFGRGEPYIAAALALILFSPAVIWNAEHGWVSFAFQTGRAAAGRIDALSAARTSLESVGEQVVSLSPWIFVPALIAAARALRPGAASDERLMLWLAAPTLIFFAALPFFGQRAIPHWFNSGWLFAYPLIGAWFSGLNPRWARAWAVGATALATLSLVVYLPFVIYGPARLAPGLFAGRRDPTGASYDWPNVAAARTWRDGGAPDFVVVDHWRTGGRIGAALGPKTPICAFTPDPRGFAFACDARNFVGRDALIVVSADKAGAELPEIAGYFERIDSVATFPVGRFGAPERRLALARAHNLIKPYPLPYGPGAAPIRAGR